MTNKKKKETKKESQIERRDKINKKTEGKMNKKR